MTDVPDGPATGAGPAPGHDPWFPYRQPGGSAGLRLFCLPHAGGSAALFRSWQRRPPPGVEIVPVQPPGRRERVHEPPLRSATAMAEQLGAAMLPLLDRPFALFGISMGALVAFETTRWLPRRGSRPAHLFVASYPAPRRPHTTPPVRDSSDAVLVRALAGLGVTPPALLADKEMQRLLLPVIRADFAVTETYVHSGGPPVDVPITVLRGAADPHVPVPAADGWRAETTSTCTVLELDAGHFLLEDRPAEVLAVLARTLAALPGPAFPAAAGRAGDA